MALNLFGDPIKKDKPAFPEERKVAFVAPQEQDGATVIESGTGSLGAYSTFIDFEGQFKTEQDLIKKYRDVAMQPEADDAIADIINESIVIEEDRQAVEVVLDDTDFSAGIKKKITEEFGNVLNLLDFSEQGHDLFKNWYIDGRLFFHVIKDPKNKKDGIKELRRISPLQIKKVVNVEKESKNVNGQTVEFIKDIEKYYVFLDNRLYYRGQALKIHPDEICFVNSGIYDRDHKFILSNLHKAIKPINQLRMIEDAVIIYRLARAPERRVFYIDVGNLPKQKAEQTIKSLISKYRNKVTYDAVSGEVSSTTNQLSMMEDFWLPRREGGKGTQVETLPGGQNLGEIEDVVYFQKRMYKSLNVPVSRLEPENGFTLGRSSEISRDELKFSKFVNRLRKRFSHLFIDLLKTQLLLKNIVTEDEWETEKNNIRFDFIEDNHFSELKNSEIMAERINRIKDINDYVGVYYSKEWVRKNVLMQTEDEIEELDKQIDEERKAGVYEKDKQVGMSEAEVNALGDGSNGPGVFVPDGEEPPFDTGQDSAPPPAPKKPKTPKE